MVLSLLLFLILVEGGLRLGEFIFFVAQNYSNRIFIQHENSYRIMCLGESTTALGGKAAYPRQLEEILNQRNPGIKFRVLNKGIPGTNTARILSQLEENLNAYNPDMVVAMVGVNDTILAVYGNSAGLEKKNMTGYLKVNNLVKFIYRNLINKLKENSIDEIMKTGKLGSIKEAILKRTLTILQGKEGYMDLAAIYVLQGDQNKAEECYKEYLKFRPQDNKAYGQLGWMNEVTGDLPEAENYFNKFLETNPQNDWAYTELGLVYAKQDKYPQAEAAFKEAIGINSDNDRACNGLARLYVDTGRKEFAQEYFKKTNRTWEKCLPQLISNYLKIKEILDKRKIKLICVQYPLRRVEPLKNIFEGQKGVIAVDNNEIFKEAVEMKGYREYFIDKFAGDFGHCTEKGNRLLAENIADTISKEVFHR